MAQYFFAVFFILFFCNIAKANVIFDEFGVPTNQPTLSSLHPGTAPVNSGYLLTFTPGTDASYDFVYYRLNPDHSITPLYYKITADDNPDKNGTVYTLRRDNLSGPVPAGYYKGIGKKGITYGGAIYNFGYNIGDITADFIGNYVLNNGSGQSYGGAIRNNSSSFSGTRSTIGNITGDFIGNSVTNINNHAWGGAIYNNYIVGNITGDFIGNYITSGREASGGAIYNSYIYITNNIGNIITGDFIGNHVSASYEATGGAIYNHNTITGINGNFIGNHTQSTSANAHGGAIENEGTINSITGDFIGNYASSNSSNNYRGAKGGAIYNFTRIDSISGSFINNYASTTNILSALSLGGAIYTQQAMAFSAAGRDIVFTGNYTEDPIRGKIYNAIFLPYSNPRTLTFNTANAGSITFNDQIEMAYSVSGATINYGTAAQRHNIFLTGDGSGTVVFNNSIINAGTVSVADSVLRLGSHKHADEADFSHGLFIPAWDTAYNSAYAPVSSLILNNGHLFLNYNSYQQLRLTNLTSTGTNNDLSFGANFKDHASDSIHIADTLSGTLNLRQILLSGKIDSADLGSPGSPNYWITLFSNPGKYINIDNLDTFRLIYKGDEFKLSQDNEKLYVSASTGGKSYIIYIPVDDTMDMEQTNLDTISNKGIIYNDGVTTINASSFSNNTNAGNAYSAAGDGGVIYNSASGDLEVVNSDFIDNTTSTGWGGAIYNAGDLTLTADHYAMTFSGNTDKLGANDIYMEAGTTLNLNVLNDGSVSFEDGITGDAGGYTITITGDNTGKVNLDTSVKNATSVRLSDVEMVVGTGGSFENIDWTIDHGTLNLANGSPRTFDIDNLTSQSGYIQLDVDPVANASTVLDISGDLTGTTHLILDVLSPDKSTDRILFAQTPNDNLATEGGFGVYRVIGSPFEWTAEYDAGDLAWYLPIPKLASNTLVNAELIPYLGLHAASLEQTRSMIWNIKNKVSANKAAYGECNVYDEAYDREPLYNAWVNPVYFTSTLRDPVHQAADIWGLEAGFDIQSDAYNKLGVFASYRKGNYEYNGKGRRYYSAIGSETDIDSYMGGVYYRYDRNSNWVFASLHAGIHNADIHAGDGVKSDSNGTELGGSLEAGHLFQGKDDWTLEPSIGLLYRQIDLGNSRDIFGKTAKYGTIRQAELETGVRIEKTIRLENGTAKVYVKPSLIRPFTSGDEADITGLSGINTYYDSLLGRLELGAKYSISTAVSAYGFTNYTYGSSYQAASFGLGLNWCW